MEQANKSVNSNDWKSQISQSCRDLETLQEWIAARDPSASLSIPPLEIVLDNYQMGITPYYFGLIQKFDNTDPIYRQIIPTTDELNILPYELDDPIGDDAPSRGSRPLKALVHRYPTRVLLFPTALCAVYCRFCFRKRLVGQAAHNAREKELSEAYEYIRSNNMINEVILTGGDPLTLGDRQLMKILNTLDKIDHVATIRIHTRMPVVNPYRLTKALGARISDLNTPVWISSHFNHAVELSPTAIAHTGSWIKLGIPFLNQSVLLQGVNDNFKSMQDLLLGLIAARIKPYYLHRADLVKGTEHLRVDIKTGLSLMKSLRGAVPGYAIPHFMFDDPAGTGKVPLEHPYDVSHPEEW